MNNSKTLQNRLKDQKNNAWVNGTIGVIIFSGSIPATKVAIMDFNPFFLTFTRATVAGLLALFILILRKEKRPTKKQVLSLIVVSIGCVVGFPLLSAISLQYVTSAHSIVFLGMLPLTTAIFGVVLGGERPRPAFWLFSILGSAMVIGFAITQGAAASSVGDILMSIAVIICGFGYAEGAKLTKTIGGWQVISWALVVSLPVTASASLILLPASFSGVGAPAWFSLAYISIFSMFIGFVFWYRGLAQGGTAAVGQLQLLQPFLGFTLAVTLLGEEVNFQMIGVCVCVIICVVLSKKFAK